MMSYLNKKNGSELTWRKTCKTQTNRIPFQLSWKASGVKGLAKGNASAGLYKRQSEFKSSINNPTIYGHLGEVLNAAVTERKRCWESIERYRNLGIGCNLTQYTIQTCKKFENRTRVASLRACPSDRFFQPFLSSTSA
jgi:hypothetical protein